MSRGSLFKKGTASGRTWVTAAAGTSDSVAAIASGPVAAVAVGAAVIAAATVVAFAVALAACVTPAAAGTTGTLTGLSGSVAPAGAGAPASAPGLPPGSALKLVLGIVVVLAAIFALQRLARVTGHRLGATGSGPEEIRIVSQRPVGPRLSLALVQVMGRSFLVGVSPQGIRPVADLGEAAAAVLPPVRAGGERASLRVPDLLKGIFGFSVPRNAAATSAMPTAGTPEIEAAPGFESELARRLAAFRERYRTVGEILPEPEGERS